MHLRSKVDMMEAKGEELFRQRSQNHSPTAPTVDQRQVLRRVVPKIGKSETKKGKKETSSHGADEVTHLVPG